MSKDKSKAALPFTGCGEEGLTMRDYFAAKALAGYWANSGPDLLSESADVTARQCYQMADAMLKERAK